MSTSLLDSIRPIAFCLAVVVIFLRQSVEIEVAGTELSEGCR